MRKFPSTQNTRFLLAGTVRNVADILIQKLRVRRAAEKFFAGLFVTERFGFGNQFLGLGRPCGTRAFLVAYENSGGSTTAGEGTCPMCARKESRLEVTLCKIVALP